MQYDYMLEEICKASTMKAVSALSKFLKTPLKINIRPVEIDSIQKIKLPIYTDKTSIGLFMPIKNSTVKGGSSLFYTKKSALAVCDLLLNRTEGSTKEITDIEESALKELANILLGNFLTPFAHSLLTATLMHSPATFENTNSDEVVKHIRSLLIQAIGNDTALNIRFSYENQTVKGDINIVLEAEKIKHLLKDVMVIANG